MYTPTQQGLDEFLSKRRELLIWCEVNGADTLKMIILEGNERTIAYHKQFISKPEATGHQMSLF